METEKKCKSKEKEYVNNYNKLYYQKNREARLKHLAEKTHCDICDCVVSNGKLSKHKQSKKHILNSRIYELETEKGLKK